jgi:predicted MFS family arabinose efflux permease
MSIDIGRGLYSTSARALLSELFVERRGQVFGVNMASIDVSGAAAAGLAVAVVFVSDWPAIFVPVLAMLLPILFLLKRWSNEPMILERVSFDFWHTSQRIYRTTQIRRLLIAYSLFMFTIRGVLGFLPTYLQAEQGLSTGVASTAFATLFVVGLFTKLLAGDLSDWMCRPIIGASVLVIGAIGMGAIVTASSLPVLFVGVGIYAVGQKSFGPVMQAYLMVVFPDDSMGG